MTGGTRWLDDAEQRTWRSFLAATRLIFERVERDLQRDAELPLGYYEILVRLSEAPGRALRMSELADGVLSSRSRLSHAVARMQERGWITRTPSCGDGRGWDATLTDDGMAALREIAPGHVEQVRAVLFDLLDPAQQRALREACESIVAGLGDEAGEHTGGGARG